MTRKYTKNEFIQAFWSKVKKTRTCWLWMGSRNTVRGEEYGLVLVNGKTRRAHRIAYKIRYGRIQKGKLILHSCDNPPCVRWSHLFEGSSKDNAIDRNRKGRMTYHRGDNHWTRRRPELLARGKRSGRYTHPEKTARGENHGMAKLSNQDVRRIRKLYLTGNFSYRQLALKFDVSNATIGMLMLGKNWKFGSKSEGQKLKAIRMGRFGVNQYVKNG